MMRYFITLSYDGSAYHGWQIQPNGTSVQETLQQALSTLLRTSIEVVGAGRTDAGVHATMMVAHFDFPASEDEICAVPLDCAQLTYKLNKILPPDIAVQQVRPVANDMHARFNATLRTYHYFVHLRKDPFRRRYSWQLYGDIDFHCMNEAASTLLEYRDFTSFSKVNTDTKTNECIITEAHWDELEPGVWRFTISANRFLRNMVRAIVGTLIEVGRGKLSIEDFRQVIEQKNRCSAGESVPGNALFLVDIKY
ncbi:MAG: tRNA pseudouridine(38-40) synthase TruA [Bacteroidaceae bacterium]|nr:tRNA pseudouridine(38-40) synthase TruA [Bacteroidaceae bacterium]